MQKTIYQTCESCHTTFPRNRKFFKRHRNKETGKEQFSTLCKECEDKLKYKENWRGGKLKCFICGKWLDPENFDTHSQYEYRNHKDKRCKQCKRKQNLEARANYSDEQKLYKIVQDRWLAARSRAEKKNIPFTITKDDILELWENQNGKCAISNIPMTFEIDNGRVFTNVSVDQKNPGQGYTKENTQLICQAVNQLKSDWDMDTVLYICKSITENYK